MVFVETGDLRIHYELSGPPQAPVLVLSHSIGTGLGLWDPQMATLASTFRVLRYDMRGHGRTATTPAPYTVERLAKDVLQLLDALSLPRVHFCGLSLGGLVGMWLGAHAPDRLHKLVLSNTAARLGTPEAWEARIATVRQQGMSAIVPVAAERWFTAAFSARAPEAVRSALAMLEATPVEGYAGCCAALRDADFRADVESIRALTLVVSGRDDPATPPADARFIADRIRGSRYVELVASHLSNIEAADAFTAEVRRFLAA